MKLKIFEYHYLETETMEEAVNAFAEEKNVEKTDVVLRNENVFFVFVWYTEKRNWDSFRTNEE